MKKIMIVDDNYLSAEGIEKNIDWETLNAEIIHVCYNGTSAIEAMKKEPADLIISDIEMPDLDGISMSRQALEINPMVKIILISAYDKFEYASMIDEMWNYSHVRNWPSSDCSRRRVHWFGRGQPWSVCLCERG